MSSFHDQNIFAGKATALYPSNYHSSKFSKVFQSSTKVTVQHSHNNHSSKFPKGHGKIFPTKPFPKVLQSSPISPIPIYKLKQT